MGHLIALAVGFCAGLAFGMHIAEAMLEKIRRDLARLEQQQATPTQAVPETKLASPELCPISGLPTDFLRDMSESRTRHPLPPDADRTGDFA